MEEKIKSFDNSLNVVFVGHVDHGKSTSLGHLLYLLQYLSPHEFEEIEKEASSQKKSNQKFSFVLDTQPEEREKGKTHAFNCIPIVYQNKHFVFYDTPGHKQLVQEMIQGSHQADLGVLVCSVKKGELESGLSGQTQEHLNILRGLGVKNLIVALNKMDLIRWNQEIFNEHKTILYPIIHKIGFKKVEYCGISGWTGENLLHSHLSFGPSLIERISTKEKKTSQTIQINNNNTNNNIDNNTQRDYYMICAKMIIMDTFKSILSAGFSGILHSGDYVIPVQITKIKDKVFAKANDIVSVIMKTEKSQSNMVEDNSGNITLVRNIILRDNDGTVAMGLINST